MLRYKPSRDFLASIEINRDSFSQSLSILPSETNTGLIVGLVVGGVAVVGAGVGIGVALKKKKAAK